MNFERSEFDERYARLRLELEREGLDALLVTNEANFNYFTGFIVRHSWASLSRNLIAILPREGEPAIIAPTSLVDEARRDGWIDRVYRSTAVGEAPVDEMVQAIRDLGLDPGRIGAELGYEQRLNISQIDFERLKAALPSAHVADASRAIWRIRMTKSEAEIACLRRACEITDVAYERIFREARAGMTERQLAQRIGQLMMEAGADRPGWVFMTSGPGEYHRVLGTPRDRVLQPGEMLFTDLAAIYNGYWSDFCRTGVFGGPTAGQQNLQTTIDRITRVGVEAVRPGIPVSAVAEALDQALAVVDLTPRGVGRFGHGLGLLSTEPPNVSRDDQTILDVGMVITIEPTVIRFDGVYECEQVVVVREDGFEVLSKSPTHIREL